MTRALALASIVLAALVAVPAFAQSGGPDAFGYVYEPTAYDFYDISAVGALRVSGDEASAAVTLPWTFEFYGVGYSTVYVGDNGTIRFSSGLASWNNACLPELTNGPDIAPFWDDLDPTSSGGVYTYYDSSGDRFIVSWESLPHYQGSGSGSFQVQLFPDGSFEFHWSDVSWGSATWDGGSGASVGIQDSAGGLASTRYLQWSCNAASVVSGTATRFYVDACPDLDGDGFDPDSCGGLDCDDTNAQVGPGAQELCNGFDDDCDPATNENGDGDGDGVTPCGGDCDDAEVLVSPAWPELCDGLDNDCDGSANATGEDVDSDFDGSVDCLDCAPFDGSTYPGAPEQCDGQDHDCDGLPAMDVDGDGVLECDDCDDADPLVFPGATEVCDGVDTDCDGQTLGGGTSTWETVAALVSGSASDQARGNI